MSANLRRHSRHRGRERSIAGGRVSRGWGAGFGPELAGDLAVAPRRFLELVGERLERGRAGLHLGAEAVVDVGGLGQQLLLAGGRGAGAPLGSHLGQAVLGVEDTADLLEVLPEEVLELADAGHPLDVGGGVAAGAAHGAAGGGQQVELLVVAQRACRHPGLVSGAADGEQGRGHRCTILLCDQYERVPTRGAPVTGSPLRGEHPTVTRTSLRSVMPGRSPPRPQRRRRRPARAASSGSTPGGGP